ncbi:hypothetical protein V8G54_019035 [Vigna mungo]|uniref:Uncharacterized protein n=1 Tax=Vigna mungo TaxID=3915 RepID=A0AAQ3RV74_VIGMU
MGKPEGMDKLKNIASGVEIFDGGEEMDSVPFLIVDSLLATMGGVESFEEDEDNNPPSVMLNSRAAIVAGELIPWLPYAGDTDDSNVLNGWIVRSVVENSRKNFHCGCWLEWSNEVGWNSFVPLHTIFSWSFSQCERPL